MSLRSILLTVIRTIGVALALPLGLVCAGAALAAQGGRWSASLDALAHFAPFWLAGALGVVAAGVVLARGALRGALVVLGLVGALAAGSLMAPEYLRDAGPHADAKAPLQLKLLQFNVWWFNADVERTADWIAAQNADVIVLEEARASFRDALLRRGHYHVSCDGCSVTILTRAQPVAWGGLPGPWPSPAMTYVTFATAQGPFTVFGVHLSWPTSNGLQQRQGANLGKVLSTYPRSSLIVSGDFNSTPWSFTRRRMDRDLGLIRRTRAVFSWPARDVTGQVAKVPFPFLPIDHVYAGREWRTVSVKRGPRLGSDHYPVIVTLARDPATGRRRPSR
ncbi:MAG: endonuclease/exonuclease/phosphatase family protein [Phenylobacterium sp.]|uniref:endonuclease/exonuclease/phosphatase family protein n=1 Tax=Phenylobacterium sp. TaxID=1871053 RepID=UPI0027362D22|nr:endonuclease/exonuclease/phosphatase family protein [Phenylobacterium sp.]MDP3174511.1 endonuclease/exonuclease/phosphatase family protein [Phenylobacterium sp.]